MLHATDLKVVRGPSAISAEDSLRDVAASLGVDGLLTGSVQRMGDQIKMCLRQETRFEESLDL